MIIGVDVDGVLTDLYGYIKKKVKEFLKDEKPGMDKISHSRRLFEQFGLTREQEKRFWDKYIWDYSKNVKHYKNASKYLKKLKEDGYEIYIITLRSFFGPDDENGRAMEKIIFDGFKENGIIYDKIFGLYEKREKVSCILENKVDLMIDDSCNNLIQISEHIPTICYDTKYNKDLVLENMTRCKNWKQIYKTICKMNEMRGENAN